MKNLNKGEKIYRTCKQCGEEFIPSSGHLRCPSCRGRDRNVVPCPGCGKLIRKEFKTCSSCSGGVGEKNHNWRGGKTYHKAGYVMVQDKSHKRSSSGGYVFEHVIVMEKILGRLLNPGETVHHKNGIKDDNRPENLELWTTNHPSGSRVSDLVSWAKDILNKYDPDSLKL